MRRTIAPSNELAVKVKGGTPKLEQLLTVEHKLLLLKIAARQKQLDDAKLAAVRQDLESQNLYIRRICDFITRQAEVFHMHAQTPHESARRACEVGTRQSRAAQTELNLT